MISRWGTGKGLKLRKRRRRRRKVVIFALLAPDLPWAAMRCLSSEERVEQERAGPERLRNEAVGWSKSEKGGRGGGGQNHLSVKTKCERTK